MKYWILILPASFMLITAPDIQAHNLVAVYGQTQDHQHVYRRQQYGKPLQQGHLVGSPGGQRTIVWGLTRSDYGKTTVRRRGPIIGEQYRKPGVIHIVSSKYGSAVNSYGKAVKGYGNPDRGK